MKRKLTMVVVLGAFSTLLLAGPTFGQGQSNRKAQTDPKQSGCCRQGMQGRQGQMMGGMGGDMMTAHQLVMQHEQVKRTVKQLSNGVETVTESDDAAVAAKIKEHVPAMYRRLKENQPIRQMDPLVRELFRYGSKIDSKVTFTPNGVRVVETSTDPYVVKLIKAHAETVTGLVKRGMEAMHEMHEAPKR